MKLFYQKIFLVIWIFPPIWLRISLILCDQFWSQIICLSATANKLSNIQKQAEEYAALIMEELDPDDSGYIMVTEIA